MTRLGAVFWGGLVLASGFATFNVKYAVQGIDDELTRVRRQTIAEQQEIRVLTAEWAYLNQPDRLAELNRNFLQLAPLTAKQLQGRVEEIALRAPPARPSEPMMAADEPPASAQSLPPATGDRRDTGAATHFAAAAGTARASSATGDSAAALAEALHLLGVEGERQTSSARFARMAPIAAAHAAELPAAADEGGVAAPAATIASGTAPAVDKSPDSAALAEALRVLGRDGGRPPRVRMANATPASLDALISSIANSR